MEMHALITAFNVKKELEMVKGRTLKSSMYNILKKAAPFLEKGPGYIFFLNFEFSN
jgi:hypothetical protein